MTIHAGALAIAALRICVIGPIANLYVARLHERVGRARGASDALAGLALAGYLVGTVAMLAAIFVFPQTDPRAVDWIAACGLTLAIADITMALGVMLGMAGTSWRSLPEQASSPEGWVVLIAVSWQLITGVTNALGGVLRIEGTFFHVDALTAPLIAMIGILLLIQRESNGTKVRPRVFVTLVLLALFGGVSSDATALPELRRALAIIVHLGVIAAFIAGRRVPAAHRVSPAADYLPVFIMVYLLSVVARAYVASLALDVHVADSYLVIGEFHLTALLLLAIGGPMALRYFQPSRFVDHPIWTLKAAPLMIGLATAWLGLAMLSLGHAGMPRRYIAYLPEFTIGHRSAGAAALLLCAGLALEAWMWASGRRRAAASATLTGSAAR
ncbi:hypothetical protein [Enhygromyxa salina]|uniref:hypothetical protein n=1 Tax=Enhygromyxa salina TaxID=215803 RepID=UPI0011BAC5E7|nr:hypothetical protein [Enhygromyxa salina]